MKYFCMDIKIQLKSSFPDCNMSVARVRDELFCEHFPEHFPEHFREQFSEQLGHLSDVPT